MTEFWLLYSIFVNVLSFSCLSIMTYLYFSLVKSTKDIKKEFDKKFDQFFYEYLTELQVIKNKYYMSNMNFFEDSDMLIRTFYSIQSGKRERINTYFLDFFIDLLELEKETKLLIKRVNNNKT